MMYEKNMMYEKFAAFQKAYDLVLYLIPILNRFPKSQRFTLAQEIEKSSIKLLKYLMAGSLESGSERIKMWHMASRELDVSRILIRLAKDLRFVSVRRYGICAEKINEAGKYIGGLLKSSSSQSEFGSSTAEKSG